MNILIGDISSYKAIVIAKYIKKHYKDIKIFTCSPKAYTGIFHTKFSDEHFVINCKDLSDPNYVKELSELIKQRNIHIYIPVNSKEMDNVLKNKEILSPTLNYWGSYEQFSSMNEKNKLAELTERLGVRVPKNYKSLEEAVIPFVCKPKKSSSSKGVVYIKSEKDLNAFKSISPKIENYVIQEYVKGKGVGYSVFSNKGKIEVGFGHIRLAEYPIKGGSSVYRGNYINKDMEIIAEKILKETKWSGFAMFEYKLTDKNEICLIEINPRIWGSINQGLENGVNYFSFLFGNVKIEKPANEVKTYLSPVLFLSLFKYALKGDFSHLYKFIRNIEANTPDVFFLTDPLGYLSMVLTII